MGNKFSLSSIIKTSVLTLFLLMQVYLIFMKRHHTLDLEVYHNTNPSPNIIHQKSLGQTFVPTNDNISRFEVRMGTYGRKNDKDIIFSLWELTPEKKLLAEKVFNAAAVVNNLFNPVDISPVRVSQDKMYYFQLISPESTPENSVCVWLNNKDIYKQGDFLINDQKTSSDMTFRVYSKQPIYKELGRITRNYTGIFASKTFLIISVVFFEAVQILILIKLLNFIVGYLGIAVPKPGKQDD